MLAIQSLAVLTLVGSASAIQISKRVEASTSKSYAAAGLRMPKARGWSNETVGQSPCGGFPTSETRAQWPMTGGEISILITEDSYNLEIGWANVTNPTSNDDFKPLINTLSGGDQIGHTCVTDEMVPDMASLGFSVGQELTLQLQYNSGVLGKDTYYQCADIVLVEDSAYNRTAAMCFSATVSSSSLDEGATSYHGSSSSSKPLSAAAGGGIGAGVSIAVFLLALLALWKFGFAAFGRKNAAAKQAGVLPGPGGNAIDSDSSSQGSSAIHHEKR